MLAALANPQHPQHAHFARMIPGGSFDPKHFDLLAIKRSLLGVQV